jgi:hypothetical protein
MQGRIRPRSVHDAIDLRAGPGQPTSIKTPWIGIPKITFHMAIEPLISCDNCVPSGHLSCGPVRIGFRKACPKADGAGQQPEF